MITTLSISGMNCQHCVAAVTRAIQAVPGVDSVTVDLAGARASIAGDSPAAPLIAAVVAAGYGAEAASDSATGSSVPT